MKAEQDERAKNDNLKENIENKVVAFQSVPDDVHYPSEKLLSDSLAKVAADMQAVVQSERQRAEAAEQDLKYWHDYEVDVCDKAFIVVDNRIMENGVCIKDLAAGLTPFFTNLKELLSQISYVSQNNLSATVSSDVNRMLAVLKKIEEADL